MVDVFGFPVTAASGGGDFLPIIQYDARAGRMFRSDRVDNGGTFQTEKVDITANFKAMVDFENIEIGFIRFAPNTAPDFRMVPIGSQLPDQPSEQHSYGLRFMLKLSKECGGDKPIREIAGTSKAFRAGVEPVYLQYVADRANHPGKLPVLVLEKTTPVKTGTGERSSTNYHPTFKIAGWAPRGDLVFEPKASAAPSTAPTTAPTTGSTRAAAPVAAPEMADDFG